MVSDSPILQTMSNENSFQAASTKLDSTLQNLLNSISKMEEKIDRKFTEMIEMIRSAANHRNNHASKLFGNGVADDYYDVDFIKTSKAAVEATAEPTDDDVEPTHGLLKLNSEEDVNTVSEDVLVGIAKLESDEGIDLKEIDELTSLRIMPVGLDEDTPLTEPVLSMTPISSHLENEGIIEISEQVLCTSSVYENDMCISSVCENDYQKKLAGFESCFSLPPKKPPDDAVFGCPPYGIFGNVVLERERAGLEKENMEDLVMKAAKAEKVLGAFADFSESTVPVQQSLPQGIQEILLGMSEGFDYQLHLARSDDFKKEGIGVRGISRKIELISGALQVFKEMPAKKVNIQFLSAHKVFVRMLVVPYKVCCEFFFAAYHELGLSSIQDICMMVMGVLVGRSEELWPPDVTHYSNSTNMEQMPKLAAVPFLLDHFPDMFYSDSFNGHDALVAAISGANPGLSLSFMKGVLFKYFSSDWSFALVKDYDIDVHCLEMLIKAGFKKISAGSLDGLSPEHVLICNFEEGYVKLVHSTEAALLSLVIVLMADVEEEEFNTMNAKNIAMAIAENMTQMFDRVMTLMHAIQVMYFQNRKIVDRLFSDQSEIAHGLMVHIVAALIRNHRSISEACLIAIMVQQQMRRQFLFSTQHPLAASYYSWLELLDIQWVLLFDHEILSTLDDAQRANFFKNNTEMNQKMMKSTLIEYLYAEIQMTLLLLAFTNRHWWISIAFYLQSVLVTMRSCWVCIPWSGIWLVCVHQLCLHLEP